MHGIDLGWVVFFLNPPWFFPGLPWLCIWNTKGLNFWKNPTLSSWTTGSWTPTSFTTGFFMCILSVLDAVIFQGELMHGRVASRQCHGSGCSHASSSGPCQWGSNSWYFTLTLLQIHSNTTWYIRIYKCYPVLYTCIYVWSTCWDYRRVWSHPLTHFSWTKFQMTWKTTELYGVQI